MKEEERRAAFAQAFISQARSDWGAYEIFATQAIPACHRLHYLQMTCEKVAKAYRLRDTKADVDRLATSHVGFEKFVGAFGVTLKDEYAGREEQLARLIRSWRKYAREVEKLAPATNRATTPENAEYPWETADAVIPPCQYGFPALEFLREPAGRAFLKLIMRALADFERRTL
jgi:hypothetical protein